MNPMNAKTVVTIALLLFVGASLVALAVNGLTTAPNQPAPGSAKLGAEGNAATEHTPGGIPAAMPAAEKRVLVLYFHGNMRCPTCRQIEQYAHEAVQSGFAEQLKSGKVTWQVINYEQPGNEAYVQRYELVAPSVVLVALDGQRQVKYENLTEVWQLVGDRQAFFKFIHDHLRAMLDHQREQD